MGNTWYLCDTSNVTTLKCDADNSTTSRFAMLIENETPDQLKIDEIYIQDITNYYYGVNAFCLDSNILDVGRDSEGTNCSIIDDSAKYDAVCVEDHNTGSCSKNVIVSFQKDYLFSNPNSYQEGIVSVDTASLNIKSCLPTINPTKIPTFSPSAKPTDNPIIPGSPTKAPSFPTIYPTLIPTMNPSQTTISTTSQTMATSQTMTTSQTMIPTISPTMISTMSSPTTIITLNYITES